MNLLNPTDDELNAVFAEKVAGWRREPVAKGNKKVQSHILLAPNTQEWGLGYRGEYAVVWKDGKVGGSIPKFTTSADAVLPWLEKAKSSFPCSSSNGSASLDKGIWAVAVPAPSWDDDAFCGEDKSFAKAAVLALLRAHGVEIEFT